MITWRYACLKDDQAIKYLESKGLPIDEALLSVTDMTPPEFQKYFLTSNDMQAVRNWVNSNGKNIYLQYLLLHPGNSLLEPVYEASKLMNGSSVEYRREKQPVRPIPEVITRISKIFYPRSPLILGFMLVICIAGAAYWLLGSEKTVGMDYHTDVSGEYLSAYVYRLAWKSSRDRAPCLANRRSIAPGWLDGVDIMVGLVVINHRSRQSGAEEFPDIRD